MRGKGPREERETTITFNEADDTASIWTASEAVYKKLKKRGFFPTEDGDRHASFQVPKKAIRLPSQPRKLSEAQRAEIARRMQVTGRFPGRRIGI